MSPMPTSIKGLLNFDLPWTIQSHYMKQVYAITFSTTHYFLPTTHFLMDDTSILDSNLAQTPKVLWFPFLFTFTLHFSILIPFHSIRTVPPFHSHVTNPRGFPCSPYLWLTSLEAYFFSSPALPCTAKHCLMTHTDSLSSRDCASPLFPFCMTYYDSTLIFPGQSLTVPSTYKYSVGQPV